MPSGRTRVVYSMGPENLRMYVIVLCPNHRRKLDEKLEPTQTIIGEWQTGEKCRVCQYDNEKMGWRGTPSLREIHSPIHGCPKCVMKPLGHPIGSEVTCNDCGTKWVRRTKTLQQSPGKDGKLNIADIGTIVDWEKVS